MCLSYLSWELTPSDERNIFQRGISVCFKSYGDKDCWTPQIGSMLQIREYLINL